MAYGNDPPFTRSRDLMDEDEQDAMVSKAIQEAIAFVESELVPDRALATQYYKGEALGNEMEGRSQARITEVRDGIIGALPSVLRIVHGPYSVSGRCICQRHWACLHQQRRRRALEVVARERALAGAHLAHAAPAAHVVDIGRRTARHGGWPAAGSRLVAADRFPARGEQRKE